MKLIRIFLVVIVAVALLSCTSAQDRAAKSQEEINKQRLELVGKYKDCMKKAEGDKAKEVECDQYLKAADALK